jgi:NAD-dependent deacetylase
MPGSLVAEAAAILRESQCVVALTGAGISTPSGIPDFRSEDSGLWTRFDPMQVASLYGFKTKPEAFYEWVRPLIQNCLNAQPNPAHVALAQLEAMGKLRSIITQNIDMLHTRAGSKHVHEMHGHMRDATCIECFGVYPAEQRIRDFLEDSTQTVIRCPSCKGILKPNVVLYGEQLPMDTVRAAERDIRQSDLVIVAGSSLETYPVADLPREAQSRGARLILINYDTTSYDKMADVVIHGDVAEVLPNIVELVEKKIE